MQPLSLVGLSSAARLWTNIYTPLPRCCQVEDLSHELRPPHVLQLTMDYMLNTVLHNIDYAKLSDWLVNALVGRRDTRRAVFLCQRCCLKLWRVF